MPELISSREYARRLGISEGAVRKAIGEGKISRGYDPAKKKINEAVANAEWGYRHQSGQKLSGVSRVAQLERLESNPKKPAAPDPVRSAPVGLPPMQTLETLGDIDLFTSLVIHTGLTALEAAKYREIIGAALDKIKLAEAEGRLVQKDKVHKALYALGSELKKALLNIPVRVCREIMAADNEVDAIRILEDEINATLTTYGNLNENSL